MTPDEIEKLLNQGIEAIKRGAKTHGRDLLLAVAEADPRNEQAWMWLSVAVDDPEDKLIALENVLAINPDNTTARTNARWWRAKIASEQIGHAGRRADTPPPPEEPPSEAPPPEEENPDASLATALALRPPAPLPPQIAEGYAPVAPLEPSDDGIDDPYQCAYCGRPTEPLDKRCSHCGRGLLISRPASVEPSSVLRTANFFVGLLLAVSIFEILPPLFARLIFQGASRQPYEVMLQLPSAELLMGLFLNWEPAIVVALLTAAVARTIALGILTIGLYARATPLYYPSILVLVADVLWNIYRAALGYHGAGGAGVDIAMALVTLPTLFAADRDFHVVKTRLVVQPDRHLKGALAFYKSGHDYRKHGMWALAVAQWRQAVGAMPREVMYQKDLGVGYAQIGRFDRSLRVLEEAARQAQEDAEIPEMIELVKAQQEKAFGRRG